MLNSRELVVYETYYSYETKKLTRRVNKSETLLVQEKAKQISERFSYWLFKDEPRRTTLLDYYNESFCAIRPRRFDGSRMQLPGKNPDVKLQRYQLDAIKRVVSSKNILLAHQVGAGKTYVMAAAAMELRRLGISKRNLFVVPNNILEQWYNEFLHLYPDASVLMIEPKNFTPGSRNRVLRHIIEHDYDAVIMSYTSFSLIPLSREERERELMEAHSDIAAAMQDVINNEAYSVLNRCSSRISHRLQKLWESEQKSEKGQIYFDDLGINTLFVDEAHNFKNISIETKHGSLPGLNTKGSKRCDDMMAKIRYVQRHNDGRGAVFATGTPITNSVSDLYTMQRYLGFDRMDRLNLAEFDNWVKMFSEVTEEFEVEANGVGAMTENCRQTFKQSTALLNQARLCATILASWQTGLRRSRPGRYPEQRITCSRLRPMAAKLRSICASLTRTLPMSRVRSSITASGTCIPFGAKMRSSLSSFFWIRARQRKDLTFMTISSVSL